MNSALKPVLPTPGVAPGGQASPAKANVANANHAVGHPQGAQNSLHHGNSLVGQNLTHHVPAPPPPAHPVPSMAPVSANMAQMAQNMSHHGNLSLVTQNSVAPTNVAASPNKSASTSAPLSLVADKPVPLALTRTPEKKDCEAPGPANGTVESPKSASNAPAALKPQNPEPNKEKQDIAKTSPSTPKPPEKPAAVPTSAPATPQKVEPAVPVSTADGPSQPKVATANEAPEKSPSKPAEPKPAPTADVAPTQSDNKPVPESANDNKPQEKPTTAAVPQKADLKPEIPSAARPEPPKHEVRKEEPKPEKPAPAQKITEEKQSLPGIRDDKTDKKDDKDKPEKKEELKSEAPKPEEPVIKEAQTAPKLEEKKPEDKKPEPKVEKPELKAAPKPKATPKSTMKLATVTPPMRKRRHTSPKIEGPSPAKRPAPAPEGASTTPATPDSRMKRNRTQVQLYQSPTPELTMATKLSASAGRQTPTKPGDDKLIVFYKNEYLAVRNAEGSFYVCQAMQNVYRTTRKIKIRWLSQDKSDPKGETYKPDFYDVTDMECVLTTLSLTRAPAGGGAQILAPAEEARAKSILQRALKAEQSGANNMELTEEHPDGLDLSLYKDESQLEKNTRKRGAKQSPRAQTHTENKQEATPPKKARVSPKRSPKSARKSPKASPKQNNKRKPAGSTPIVAAPSKTATALTEKAKGKSTPKRTPAKAKEEKRVEPTPSPVRQGRRSATAKVESKPTPVAPVPSTSTGKTTRTPRKPPAKK